MNNKDILLIQKQKKSSLRPIESSIVDEVKMNNIQLNYSEINHLDEKEISFNKSYKYSRQPTFDQNYRGLIMTNDLNNPM